MTGRRWVPVIVMLFLPLGTQATAQSFPEQTTSKTSDAPSVTVFRGPPPTPKQVDPPPNLRIMPGSPGSGSASTPTVIRGAPQDQSAK